MTLEAIKLSVVIPMYNEELRIGQTLDILETYLEKQEYGSEIIVVDDGSTDQTQAIVRDQYPEVTLVTYPKNRGKGYAMRRGVPECRGAYRLVYDADGSTPIDDIEKVWAKVDEGADIVIGSRALPDSDVQLRQPLYRQSMGRMYNVILRCLGLTPFKDTQCGFKCVSAACADVVFPKLVMDGFGMDCELLYVARMHGYRIDEVPVRWVNSPDSKVNAFFDSLDMLREVIIVRLKSFTGAYR